MKHPLHCRSLVPPLNRKLIHCRGNPSPPNKKKEVHLLVVGPFHKQKWQISLPCHILQQVKSLPFYTPEAWKRYPFRVEPPHTGHYREYPWAFLLNLDLQIWSSRCWARSIQNFRKFRSKTQWIGSVQPEKFRKNWSIFWDGPFFPVGPVGILVEWIMPINCLATTPAELKY